MNPVTSGGLSRRQLLVQTAGALGALTLGEGAGEANHPEITYHRVPVRGLERPARLVQLTDFHRSWCVSEAYLRRIADMTMGLKPDVIALTGDFITRSTAYLPSCLRILRRLDAPLGIYATLGNHDYAADDYQAAEKVTAGLHSLGIPVLTNASARLQNGLWLVGVDDCGEGRPDDELAFYKVPMDGPVLALTHNPGYFLRLRRYPVVTLSGHTHGGQINIPILSRMITGRTLYYVSGWYGSNDPRLPGRLYVCRGLGVINIPIRLRARPEISVFELTPA